MMSTYDFEMLNSKDIEFHTLVLESSRNPTFIRIAKTVMQLFERPMAEAIKSAGPEIVLSNHRAQLDAIKARDLLRAKELVTNSFQLTKDFF
jgi:DNA-binding FadR family transcriptional regulator